MAGAKIAIGTGYTAGEASGDATGNLRVSLPNASTPTTVGAIRMFSENDPGAITGNVYLASPETDDDARLRVAQDVILDNETFNYTAQNTGKHAYRNTTMTIGWTAAGMTTNATNITTITTGVMFNSYAEFPMLGQSHLYCEMEGGFTAQPTANSLIDFGLFRAPTSNPFAPTDGAYFRLTSAGLFGVINSNTTETTTSVMAFTYTNNEKHQFVVSVHERSVEFWIDGVLYGEIETPVANGQPFMSASLPVAVRHAIAGGAAGAALSFQLNDYTVSVGGSGWIDNGGAIGNRMHGSYQGLSGGTMGGLSTYVNSTNPTAAAPSNTALTANLPGGLGGQGAVTAAVAAATDGIWGSYQVPAGTANVQGRRLKITALRIDAVNIGAAVATTATTVQFSLAFGHTAVSLATAEAAAAKAPRRLALGFMTWPVGAAIGQGPQAGPIILDIDGSPIYVNPGEFVQLVGKFLVGTATASQVIEFTWQPIYAWE